MSNEAAKTHVLIIDDDPITLETASLLLTRSGYTVSVLVGGGHRLDTVAALRPDVILLDVNMPVVSGDELLESLGADPRLSEVPVVYFSSNDEQMLRQLVRSTGAAGYVSKSEMAMGFGARLSRIMALSAQA